MAADEKCSSRMNLMNAACCANGNTKFNSNSKLVPLLWTMFYTLYPNQRAWQCSEKTFPKYPILFFSLGFSYLYFNFLYLFELHVCVCVKNFEVKNYVYNVENILRRNITYLANKLILHFISMAYCLCQAHWRALR